MEYTAVLKRWFLVDTQWGYVVVGDIYGDKKERWPDGYRVRTSKIETFAIHNQSRYIITLNSTYKLED